MYHHNSVGSGTPPLYSMNFMDCNNYYDALMQRDIFILMFAQEIMFFQYSVPIDTLPQSTL